jgi:pyruvate formate lyase activating enzyme
VEGKLIAEGYGQVASLALDPIEKKPLYHFHPGSRIVSVGNNGCNLSCRFCQNSAISQERVPTRWIGPEELARLAGEHGSIGVAYTYAESLIWFEYLLDSGRLVRERGLKNVLVTNGTINPEPLRELLPVIDAMNIDLKSMNPRFYTRLAGGHLEPVLETIRLVAAAGVHLEVTNLIIPGENDDESEIAALIDFVASVNPEIPLHFSRYFPHYKLHRPPTPPETLARAWRMAREKLTWVYVGNIELPGASSSFCPSCGKVLVDRSRYYVREVNIAEGRCRHCGEPVNFVGV